MFYNGRIKGNIKVTPKAACGLKKKDQMEENLLKTDINMILFPQPLPSISLQLKGFCAN